MTASPAAPAAAPTELVDPPLDSPMSQAELNRLDVLEAQMAAASQKQLRAEIRHGETLGELKHHPRMLWQRDEMFRTKKGDWKKRRDWHEYVTARGLAESGKEADRLIDLWRQHKMHIALVQD